MKVVAIGSRVFISGFRFAGISGIQVDTAEDALDEVEKLTQIKDVCMVLISDNIAKQIRERLNEVRSTYTCPIIFEVPSPGSEKETIDYHDILKQILGVHK